MNFRDAENYLYSLGNEVETMKLGLDNIRTLLEALGNPQTSYIKVQVAGTNGKGSVCAFLDSICVHAGVKTGLYTSPHLVSITERVKIGGVDISEEDFAGLATRVRETSESLAADSRLESVPTFFEQVTAIALLAFAESKVELAILETGLGGRFDATTAANAEIAVITRIDLDHQEYLGDTIEKIAAEKAAIIRSDSKVVALHQSREAKQAIIGRCREVGVEPVWAAKKIQVIRDRDIHPWLQATFVTEKSSYVRVLFMSMLGEHQIENASLAIAVAEELGENGYSIGHEAILSGLENTEHPGRLERIGNFLLDGAHNPSGAKALRVYLDEFVNSPLVIVFGTMKEKDVPEIAKILWTKADILVLTQPANSRAVASRDLLAFAPDKVDSKIVHCADSATEAMSIANQLSSSDSTIVVTGSLYLVGEVRNLLLPKFEI